MNAPAPTPGQLWLIRTDTDLAPVAAIRSREQDAWTVLDPNGQLTVVAGPGLVRPIPGYPVPADATWAERVDLLAGFERPRAGASR